VNLRGQESYLEAADILADVREALGGEQGHKIACKHAAELVKKNPTLSRLKSALRKKGFTS